MKIFFANPLSGWAYTLRHKPPYILESFYEFLEHKKSYKNYLNTIKQFAKIFFLDSGAFTFMNSQKNVKAEFLDRFVEAYAKFIVDNDIQLFAEMDVDSIVGYEKVLEYRHFLEKVTKKKCVPVWHKSRGLEEWKRTIKAGYKFVAIGGFVIKEIKLPEETREINQLIKIAHERDVKVHGMGVISMRWLHKTLFDSVDSTGWMVGPGYGQIPKIDINEKRLKSLRPKEIGSRRIWRALAISYTVKKWLYLLKRLDTEEWDFLTEYNKNIGEGKTCQPIANT